MCVCVCVCGGGGGGVGVGHYLFRNKRVAVVNNIAFRSDIFEERVVAPW